MRCLWCLIHTCKSYVMLHLSRNIHAHVYSAIPSIVDPLSSVAIKKNRVLPTLIKETSCLIHRYSSFFVYLDGSSSRTSKLLLFPSFRFCDLFPLPQPDNLAKNVLCQVLIWLTTIWSTFLAGNYRVRCEQFFSYPLAAREAGISKNLFIMDSLAVKCPVFCTLYRHKNNLIVIIKSFDLMLIFSSIFFLEEHWHL